MRFPTRTQVRAAVPALLFALAVAAFWPSPVRAQPGDVSVMIDEVRLVRLERPGAQVIIGNPSVADVAVQNGRLLVVTGKTIGLTNLIVLDAAGKQILKRKVAVTMDPHRFIVLYKGVGRYTHICGERCRASMMPGDGDLYVEALAKQIRNKLGIAQSALDGTTQGGAQ